MSKNKLFRVFSILFFVVISLGSLAGCAAKLPDGFDKEEVKAAAENVITLLNQGDGEGLTALMTGTMKAAITEDIQSQIFAMVASAGGVKEISDLRTGGATENEITFAVVVAKVKYEKGEITYTISFDEDMKLAGLYLK